MKKILIITLIGLGLVGIEFVIPQDAEAGIRKTVVKFEIYQIGNVGFHRLWRYGQATHWDPNGRPTKKIFVHVSGPENVDFGRQLVGNSRGRADIIFGLVCRPSRCTSGMQYYRVPQWPDPFTKRITVTHGG